MVPKYALKYLK